MSLFPASFRFFLTVRNEALLTKILIIKLFTNKIYKNINISISQRNTQDLCRHLYSLHVCSFFLGFCFKIGNRTTKVTYWIWGFLSPLSGTCVFKNMSKTIKHKNQRRTWKKSKFYDAFDEPKCYCKNEKFMTLIWLIELTSTTYLLTKSYKYGCLQRICF